MAKFDAVEWMTQHGKTCYRDEIAKLECGIRIAERDGDMEHGMTMIRMYEEQIRAVRQQAQDRYDDWVSDFDWQ